MQFSILCYKSNLQYKCSFLVVLLVVIKIVVVIVVIITWLGDCKIESHLRANTVKQGILYWTCTGPAVEVIGLVPTCD